MQSTLENRTIFCRDNLDVLRGIDSNSIDLIYLDPPFNKKQEFTASIGSSAEGASFHDIFRDDDIKEEWLGLIADEHPVMSAYINGISGIGHKSNKYYLCYMAVRLIELHRVLKGSGSLYLHCDSTMSHYLKLLLDCIFGENNFRNEIVWCYRTGGISKRWFPRKHDIIFWFVKDTKAAYTYNVQKEKSYITHKYGFQNANIKKDEKGELYTEVNMRDYWNIEALRGNHPEYRGYPTQKPLSLLKRIIESGSDGRNDSHEGGIVLDPFCGCATTCIAAELLSRRWLGIDINKKVFELVSKRIDEEIGGDSYRGRVTFREDAPDRTDINK